MKKLQILIAIVLIAFTAFGSDRALSSPNKLDAPECSDFEDGTVQDWSWTGGSGYVHSPGYLSTNCLRSNDGTSPPSSRLIAPDRYHGNWDRWVTYTAAGDTCPGYVEFDYRVLEDGWSEETRDIYAYFWISMNYGTPDQVSARFSPTDPVHEDGGANDGWHHYQIPIHPIAVGDPLPGDANGQWIMTTGSDSDWNDLLQNVEFLYFILDLAQSPYQTEDFLVDNFCLVSGDICSSGGICSTWPVDDDFDGWTATGATIDIRSPGQDGSGYYLWCTDAPGSSALYGSNKFHGDWSEYFDVTGSNLCGAVVHYYYNVFNDGWPAETRDVNIGFNIYDTGNNLRAYYRTYETITEDSGWREVAAPIYYIDSEELLPNDENGAWAMIDGEASDWNDLIRNVDVIRFAVDIAQSPYQYEEFGVDDFCIQAAPCSTGTIDLWVEDTPYDIPPTTIADTGEEPDAGMNPYVPHKARSIWVRQDLVRTYDNYFGDSQNFIFGQENYIWVTVQNRGSATAFDTDVEVYGTDLSSVFVWPTNMDLLGTGHISQVRPGGSARVMVPWVPTDVGHFCLFSRVVHPDDMPMNFDYPNNTQYIARFNNNISYRNVYNVNLLEDVTDDVSVVVRNIDDMPGEVSLRFEDPDDFLGDMGVNGSLVFDLATLHAGWVSNGSQGSNIQIVPGTTKILLTGTPAEIAAISCCDEEVVCRLDHIALEPAPHPGLDHVYHLDLVQMSGGEPVGGVSYQIVARALDTDTDDDGIPDYLDPDDDDDTWSDADELECEANPLCRDSTCGGVGVDDPGDDRLPTACRLHTAVPNPFNPSTTIRFDLPQAGPVQLTVYDVAGRCLRTLVRGSREAGSHDVTWNGRDDAGRQVVSGTYFYRLQAGDYVETKWMTLLK